MAISATDILVSLELYLAGKSRIKSAEMVWFDKDGTDYLRVVDENDKVWRVLVWED